MMNYIKSEFYRITHTKEIYGATGILVCLSVLFHIVLRFWGGQYAVTSFSYSFLITEPMVFPTVGAGVAFSLYEGHRENGILKNATASGISRTKIFSGECTVSILTATIMMFVVVGAWIAGAQLLLGEKKSGVIFQMEEVLWEMTAAYLISVASVVSIILLLWLLEQKLTAIVVWAAIWYILPIVLEYLGLRFEAAFNIVNWMPYHFFDSMVVGDHAVMVWDTAKGWYRCLVSGAAGTFLFICAGICLLQKKDL